jgi:glycosyltransferase involved in cell wall biosynthesis
MCLRRLAGLNQKWLFPATGIKHAIPSSCYVAPMPSVLQAADRPSIAGLTLREIQPSRPKSREYPWVTAFLKALAREDIASAASSDENTGSSTVASAESVPMKSVVLLIPAHRPSAVLPQLIEEIRTADRLGQLQSIIVVDDGSGPEFRPTFAAVEAQKGVTVLRHAVNLGKGAALKTGFNHALLAFPDAAGVVTADADGQHAADDILRVAQALSENPHEMVLGVRGFSGNVPLRNRLGNGITRRVFQAFTGVRIADTQTGLRGWPQSSCRECLPIAINGYDFELECLLRAHNSIGTTSASIRQVPIKTIYLDQNRNSHFNPIRDSMRIYFVFIRYCGASILSAIIDSLFFYLVYSAAGNLLASQVTGRAVATAVAFVVNRKLVFHSDANVAASLAKYLTLVSATGFVSYSMLSYLHQIIGFPVIPSKLIAEGLLFIANFSIQRQIVFVRSKLSRSDS